MNAVEAGLNTTDSRRSDMDRTSWVSDYQLVVSRLPDLQ
jgi:hypothetical protein